MNTNVSCKVLVLQNFCRLGGFIMIKEHPKYILAFLSTYNGGVAIFRYNDNDYEYVTYIDMPRDQYKHVDVVEYKNRILNVVDDTCSATAFIVKPQYRSSDDSRCIYRIGVNSSINMVLAQLFESRIYYIKNPMLWQNYFNIDQTNTKESALSIARELLPEISISSTEQAEAILIGVYGIEEVIKKRVEQINSRT